ncbi:hypothetical protein [Botryobacter ruber]|uniref:hypothetical protein n=1 Tax=Botryobacter ruber TaxID=2171629 RepID=UPI000F646E85|nr:hypothetical protein [Botryobacter ruber]
MQRLKSYIALFLLLLFVRAMVPDVLLLSLHSHEHTTHTTQHDPHKAEIGKKHTHCAVAELFGAPYQPSTGAVELTPVVHTSAYTSTYAGLHQQSSLFTAYLRGPPPAAPTAVLSF